MNPAICLNCSSELAASQHFCANCGQKTSTHRITFSHLLHDFFHALTHADKGVLHLLKELTFRPGTVAREYVRGKRKKYFNPITFFLLVMVLFVFASTLLHKSVMKQGPDPSILASIPTAEGRAIYTAIMTRAGNAMYVMAKYGNVVGMIAVPFLSLITWLCFRRRGYNYSEHLTANFFFTSYNNLVFALFIIPLEMIFSGLQANQLIILAGMLFHSIYLAWGLSGFLVMRGAWNRIKVLLVGIMATMLWMLLSMTAMSLYIYQSRHFFKFLLRMFAVE